MNKYSNKLIHNKIWKFLKKIHKNFFKNLYILVDKNPGGGKIKISFNSFKKKQSYPQKVNFE